MCTQGLEGLGSSLTVFLDLCLLITFRIALPDVLGRGHLLGEVMDFSKEVMSLDWLVGGPSG